MLTPGHRLDRYELLCPIASGGMATVWLARLRGKRGFEKLVAIKTIKTELISDPSYTTMFLDEARIASGIDHPNVAQILDLGEQDENLYLVMEWVDGDSLAKICRFAARKKKPLPIDLALRVMADACAGLHAAHELRDAAGKLLGVVHRDVSPQNILVTNRGAAKVIDFGLAKADQRDAPDTEVGVVKGKIRYLSPEYVSGQSIDRRADIWAVGICLYELAIGSAPFDELGDLDVVRRLAGPSPAPDIEADAVPAALRPILARALARNPNDRFPTAAAMRRAIESAIDVGASATTDDVAEFLATVLPELAERRGRTVGKVMAAAQATPSLIPGPLARAGTPLVSVPPPPVESEPEVVLTRKKKAREEESTSTGGATLTEQLGARKPSRVGTWFFLAMVGLAAFAAFVWPGRERLVSMTTAASPPPAAASASADAAPPPAAATEPKPEPPVSAVASSSASSSASAAAPAATPARAPSLAATPAAPSRDASRPVWDYRPTPAQDPSLEPSDPAGAASAAAAAASALRAAPPVETPAEPTPETPPEP